jgi:hypothetical protein
MEVVPVRIVPRGWGQSNRREAWWITPVIVVAVFGSFIVYATWAAFQNAHYTYGPYLSPFYSPEIFGGSEHAWFGPKPGWWPALLPFSPALIILPFPGLFRFTCYYYRGAYYKAFWSDPPSCAVGEPRGKSYWGERWFPLVLQNVHRYFLYAAIIIWAILVYDAWEALWFPTATGGREFGIGVGTVIFWVNVVLLALYTFGCHAARHLVGGRKDEISKNALRQTCYDCTSALNYKHQIFAWCSLFSVAAVDIYVRLCSMGYITDLRLY